MCYIVNDLTNRELIRRKFKFENFQIIDDRNNGGIADEDDGDDDLMFEGSTIFSNIEENKVGTKDLTNEARMFHQKKG